MFMIAQRINCGCCWSVIYRAEVSTQIADRKCMAEFPPQQQIFCGVVTDITNKDSCYEINKKNIDLQGVKKDKYWTKRALQIY